MSKPITLCIVLAIGVALTAGLALSSAASSRTVNVGDNWFFNTKHRVPSITIKRNTTIRFKWLHATAHNVYVYRGSSLKFKSDIFDTKGHVYAKKLTQTGAYKIVCDIHGASDQSMKIKVTN